MVLDSIRIEFLLPDGSVGKNITTLHIDNKGKCILILGKGATQGLNDTAVTAESQYSINFTRPNIKFCLSLHFNGSNRFLFVNDTKIYQFKGKDSEIKKYLLCLGTTSGEFSANNMKKKQD